MRCLRILFFAIAAFNLGCSEPERVVLARPQDARYVEHGRTLVKGLAACGFCHGATSSADTLLSGGRKVYDRYGEVLAPNLTSSVTSGIGGWSTEEVLRAVRASRGKTGEEFTSDAHKGYAWLADEDALGIAAYLYASPPVENEVERRTFDIIDRNTKALLDTQLEVKGYIPKINPRFQLAYGQYLTEHVARCQYCHSSPSTLALGEEYLGGGKTVTTEKGEKRAPGIGASTGEDGIGNWSEADIVAYLKTGITPDRRAVDANYCPVEFYRNAPDMDLWAIAKYLKNLAPND